MSEVIYGDIPVAGIEHAKQPNESHNNADAMQGMRAESQPQQQQPLNAQQQSLHTPPPNFALPLASPSQQHHQHLLPFPSVPHHDQYSQQQQQQQFQMQPEYYLPMFASPALPIPIPTSQTRKRKTSQEAHVSDPYISPRYADSRAMLEFQQTKKEGMMDPFFSEDIEQSLGTTPTSAATLLSLSSSFSSPPDSISVLPSTPSSEANDEMHSGDSLESSTKREKRLVKNRKAAQLFRKRQKAYIIDLEKQVTQMSSRNGELKIRLDLLVTENTLLKDHLNYMRGFFTKAIHTSFPQTIPIQQQQLYQQQQQQQSQQQPSQMLLGQQRPQQQQQQSQLPPLGYQPPLASPHQNLTSPLFKPAHTSALQFLGAQSSARSPIPQQQHQLLPLHHQPLHQQLQQQQQQQHQLQQQMHQHAMQQGLGGGIGDMLLASPGNYIQPSLHAFPQQPDRPA